MEAFSPFAPPHFCTMLRAMNPNGTKGVAAGVVCAVALVFSSSWKLDAASATDGSLALAPEPATNTLTTTGTNSASSSLSTDLPATNTVEVRTNRARGVATRALSALSTASGSSPILRVKRGFRVELVASAPLVSNPVTIAFDSDGRLVVAEMPQGMRLGTQGTVTVLDDSDNDGVFDTSAPIGNNLPNPAGLASYAGGMFAAASPAIVYLNETQPKSAPQAARVVFAGFGGTNTPAGGARRVHSLQWGLDNRIHGGTAGIGGLVNSSGVGTDTVSLERHDFSFDPRTLRLFLEVGTAESGVAFDDTGRKFVSDFSTPLRTPAFDHYYFARNPFLPVADRLTYVAPPALMIYGTPASSESNALASTASWMSQARGLAVYRGHIFPTNYVGNVFIPDSLARIVHRAVLAEGNPYPAATRAPEDRGTEFVTSSDLSFRPVQVANGPDGALYIADHGNAPGAGRVFRVVPEGFQTQPRVYYSKANTRDLVAALAHRSGWHRETAARLLYEKQDPEAATLLTNVLGRSRAPLTRLHALRALGSLGALNEPLLAAALRDSGPAVRRHALQLLEPLAMDNRVSDGTLRQVQSMARDPSSAVRLQLALTLGEFREPGKSRVLAELLAGDFNMPWMQNAVLSSSTTEAGDLLLLLLTDRRFRQDATGRAFLNTLAEMIGSMGQLTDITRVVEAMPNSGLEPAVGFEVLHALGLGLSRISSSLALTDAGSRLQGIFGQALDMGVDGDLAAPVRASAIRLLGVSPFGFPEIGDWLLALASPNEPLPVQLAAVEALGRFDEPRVATGLIPRWRQFTPAVRAQVGAALLRLNSRTGAVLQAIEDGHIGAGDLSAAHLNYLRTHSDPAIASRALTLLGPVPGERPGALENLRPALRLNGSPTAGRDLFVNRCASCHRLLNNQNLPPDLSGAKALGKELALIDIVEPSRRVAPGWITAILTTKSGEVVIGGLVDENDTTVVLRQPSGKVVAWPRLTILSLERRGWSLMPAGLEQGVPLQGMADLLAFLMTR